MSQPYENSRKYGVWSSRFMDTIGDGSGSTSATAAVQTDFHFLAPLDSILLVDRLIIYIEDAGKFDVGGYGAVLTPLTLGILDGVTDPEGTFHPSGDIPVRKTADWASLSHDISYHDFGQGNHFITARYKFTEDGAPIVIPGGWKFTIRCQDDLSFLADHRFRVGGVVTPHTAT